MQQIITVRALIKQDQKILLLRRKGGAAAYRGLYELPGGKVDPGENPKETILREVQEEIGAKVSAIQPLDTYSIQQDSVQYVVLAYTVALQSAKLGLSIEHDKYVWKKMSEVQPNEITDWTRLVLQIDQDTASTNTKTAVTFKDEDKLTTINEQIYVYADGGSRGNPGPSAAGFVIKDANDQLLFEGGRYLGITTNNQAEYQAVKIALDKALELGATAVQCRLDSQLVVNQLNGIYKIKNRDLWPIHAYIKELTQRFKKITFTHVRREFNKEADAMVNKVLDEHKMR